MIADATARWIFNALVRRWSDGQTGFYLFSPAGLLLWRAWELAILRWNWPLRSLLTIDYTYRTADRDEALIKEVLEDYQLAVEQAERVARDLPLSAQWLDFTRQIGANLRPELLHDFRRNRLGMYGILSGGAILDEDEEDVKLTLSGNYSIAKGDVFRAGWAARPAQAFALRVAMEFHRIGRHVDPGVLAMADEDRVGSPVTPVHQGKHLTRNLLVFAYCITNLLRYTDLRPPEPITVCEIGGGYGGFAKLFKRTFRRATVIILDLPECLALSSFYLQSNFPHARIATVRDFDLDVGLDEQRLRPYDFVLLPWWYGERLSDEAVDLFFSRASMQEMPMEFVTYYVKMIERTARGYFYWINRWKAPERYGGVCFADYPFDDRWRTVFVRPAEESALHLHEWLGARGF